MQHFLARFLFLIESDEPHCVNAGLKIKNVETEACWYLTAAENRIKPWRLGRETRWPTEELANLLYYIETLPFGAAKLSHADFYCVCV